ncbi:MAG TPA: DNA internalization-related competence protein ComEC/Rec2 [Gammaproteobacteria bacterium]
MHRLPELPGPAWLVPAAIAALLALSRADTRWLALVIAACVFTVASAERRLGDRLPDEATGSDFAVAGWVAGFPTGTRERMTFSFVVEHAEDPRVPKRLRLGWYDAPPSLRAGERFALTVRLRAPRGLANPGGFDYEQWLLVNGFGATGYVRAGERLDTGSPSLARWWLEVRRAAAERLAAAIPDADAAALVIALAIGERFGFTDAHWLSLRRTGTSHLVAISGLHVGLVAMFAFVIVRRAWLLLPQRLVHVDLEAAAAAAAVAAILYAALAGFAVPTLRSVVMIVVGLAVAVSRRSGAWGQGLAAAVLVVLALDPFAVMSASFWLSFGAVALLVALATRRPARITEPALTARVGRHTVSLAALQLTMSFGLVPIGMAWFGEMSVVSPIVNLVAIPYFSFVLVPATLAALAATALALPGAEWVAALAAKLASLAWTFIHAAAAVPWAAITLPRPSEPVTLLALVGIVLGLPAHPLPGRLVAWCALLPVVVPVIERPAPGSAYVLVVDVGHGLAVIVETATKRLLYDAGPSFPSGFDSGADVVVPVLAARGGGLDMLIVSHADNDHSGGAPAVLDAYPDAQVIAGPDVGALAATTCVAGMRWRWDDVDFEVLHPEQGFRPLGNDSSCVLKVTAAGGSLLVLGDVERRGERALAAHGRAAADVVVVAHHGSATSSTPVLVDATGARFALVSAAHANRWGFPRPEVVARWEAAGAAVRSTAAAGALHVEMRDDGITLFGERERRRRYWRAD